MITKTNQKKEETDYCGMMRRGQRRLSCTHQNDIYKETPRLDGKQYPEDYQNTAEKQVKRHVDAPHEVRKHNYG